MSSVLEEALEAWKFARDGVLDEIRNLNDRDMAFRPGPESRRVAEIARHILESGALMVGELSRPDGDFRRKSYDGLLRDYGRGIARLSSRRDLLDALRRRHAEGAARIKKAGEIHMLQLIRRFDGKRGTRLAWMHHGISHEEYHRGQIALCARLAGLTPALTARIEGSA